MDKTEEVDVSDVKENVNEQQGEKTNNVPEYTSWPNCIDVKIGDNWSVAINRCAYDQFDFFKIDV